MAMDRRLDIVSTTTAKNRFGETETTETTITVWATQVGLNSERSLDIRGVIADADTLWRIRFRSDLLAAFVGGATITAHEHGGAGDPEVVTKISEPPNTRRRFLEILS